MIRRRLVLGLVVGVLPGLVAPAIGASTAGAQAPAAENVPSMSWLQGVACRPDRTCLGVGEQGSAGAVVVLGPGGIGPALRARGTRSLNAISCLPGGSCVAVGQGSGGAAVVVQVAADGTPLGTYPVAGANDLYDVDCPSPGTCVATGRRTVRVPYEQNEYGSVLVPVFVVVTNGVPQPAQRYPREFRHVIALDCPTTTRCVAVGSGALVVLTGSGAAWRATASVPAGSFSADDISCPTSSACYATTTGPGIREVSPDGVPGARRELGARSVSMQGISCVAEWTCTLVGLDNSTTRGFSLDVTPSGPPVFTVWDNSNWFSDISCIDAGECGLVGTAAGGPQRTVWAWKG